MKSTMKICVRVTPEVAIAQGKTEIGDEYIPLTEEMLAKFTNRQKTVLVLLLSPCSGSITTNGFLVNGDFLSSSVAVPTSDSVVSDLVKIVDAVIREEDEEKARAILYIRDSLSFFRREVMEPVLSDGSAFGFRWSINIDETDLSETQRRILQGSGNLICRKPMEFIESLETRKWASEVNFADAKAFVAGLLTKIREQNVLDFQRACEATRKFLEEMPSGEDMDEAVQKVNDGTVGRFLQFLDSEWRRDEFRAEYEAEQRLMNLYLPVLSLFSDRKQERRYHLQEMEKAKRKASEDALAREKKTIVDWIAERYAKVDFATKAFSEKENHLFAGAITVFFQDVVNRILDMLGKRWTHDAEIYDGGQIARDIPSVDVSDAVIRSRRLAKDMSLPPHTTVTIGDPSPYIYKDDDTTPLGKWAFVVQIEVRSPKEMNYSDGRGTFLDFAVYRSAAFFMIEG